MFAFEIVSPNLSRSTLVSPQLLCDTRAEGGKRLRLAKLFTLTLVKHKFHSSLASHPVSTPILSIPNSISPLRASPTLSVTLLFLIWLVGPSSLFFFRLLYFSFTFERHHSDHPLARQRIIHAFPLRMLFLNFLRRFSDLPQPLWRTIDLRK